jgi:hypothetical protein
MRWHGPLPAAAAMISLARTERIAPATGHDHENSNMLAMIMRPGCVIVASF